MDKEIQECRTCERNKHKITIDMDTIVEVAIWVIIIIFFVVSICAFFGNEDCLKFLERWGNSGKACHCQCKIGQN